MRYRLVSFISLLALLAPSASLAADAILEAPISVSVSEQKPRTFFVRYHTPEVTYVSSGAIEGPKAWSKTSIDVREGGSVSHLAFEFRVKGDTVFIVVTKADGKSGRLPIDELQPLAGRWFTMPLSSFAREWMMPSLNTAKISSLFDRKNTRFATGYASAFSLKPGQETAVVDALQSVLPSLFSSRGLGVSTVEARGTLNTNLQQQFQFASLSVSAGSALTFTEKTQRQFHAVYVEVPKKTESVPSSLFSLFSGKSLPPISVVIPKNTSKMPSSSLPIRFSSRVDPKVRDRHSLRLREDRLLADNPNPRVQPRFVDDGYEHLLILAQTVVAKIRSADIRLVDPLHPQESETILYGLWSILTQVLQKNPSVHYAYILKPIASPNIFQLVVDSYSFVPPASLDTNNDGTIDPSELPALPGMNYEYHRFTEALLHPVLDMAEQDEAALYVPIVDEHGNAIAVLALVEPRLRMEQ